ncbi:ABC transporter permease [Nocardioides sp. GY 10127]|uniref:ABC transporter permease n=1 Tax=Nocardioides sp. GY 10127 TaxID=2569762 RepID=UPI0010A868A2|nr:ABC transporter permease [Nocardioides sp. GY 10127]TIC85642.1 ABC transporter permease [Nocardioides sp. GY 10127]
MSDQTLTRRPTFGPGPLHPDDIPEVKPRRKLGLPLFYCGIVTFLLIPIVAMIVYSFNVPTRNAITPVWQGFTLDAYLNLFAVQGIAEAFFTSVAIAAASGLVSVLIGLPMALALSRYRFRGKGVLNSMIFLDISAPSIVVGSSALAFFLSLNFTMGWTTILIVHVAFNIAYVVTTLRARLSGMGQNLEQAAGDLGASPLVGFFTVTLPLVAPGIVAAFLLAFAMSIDDYVITSFVNGSTETFPLYAYGFTKKGMAPQVLCFGTIVFVVAVCLAFLNGLLNRRRP